MNSENYFRSIKTNDNNFSRFDPKSIQIVTKLLDEFNARIVISSLWRFALKKELANELNSSGLINYLHSDSFTPVLQPGHRGKEIKMWLDKHPEITDFLILDDDDDILSEHIPQLVKTTLVEGLHEEHYYKAREILELYLSS